MCLIIVYSEMSSYDVPVNNIQLKFINVILLCDEGTLATGELLPFMASLAHNVVHTLSLFTEAQKNSMNLVY